MRESPSIFFDDLLLQPFQRRPSQVIESFYRKKNIPRHPNIQMVQIKCRVPALAHLLSDSLFRQWLLMRFLYLFSFRNSLCPVSHNGQYRRFSLYQPDIHSHREPEIFLQISFSNLRQQAFVASGISRILQRYHVFSILFIIITLTDFTPDIQRFQFFPILLLHIIL